jgi:hypothetical protein
MEEMYDGEMDDLMSKIIASTESKPPSKPAKKTIKAKRAKKAKK